MVLDNYASVTSIDYSDVVIAQMQKAHAEHAELQYAVADARLVATMIGACLAHQPFPVDIVWLDTACRSMPEFTDSSFASVIDKGTLDAMACGDKAFESISSMLREVSR